MDQYLSAHGTPQDSGLPGKRCSNNEYGNRADRKASGRMSTVMELTKERVKITTDTNNSQ